MDVLTVNTGSSSVRLALFAGETTTDLRVCAEARYEADATDPRERLQTFLDQYASTRPQLVAHRVVHGGLHLTSTRRIDAAVEAEIERLAALAPLHNPVALAWIRASRALLGTDLPQVAVFDTAFYAQLPEVARTYALPRALCERHGLRRYGFHGLAHQALWSRWHTLRPDLVDGGKVVSFQLGSGCSVTAIDHGRPLDTSMGFSPLEGLVMATRSGDLDPGLMTFVQRADSASPEDMEQLLNERSGLLGVSGLSADLRVLLAADDPRARLAIDLYCYRARKYLGAFLAVLGGADAVLFGGGVGENAAVVRAGILAGFTWAGLQLDAAANSATVGREGRISASNSGIESWVIPVDEARVLATEALAAVAA